MYPWMFEEIRSRQAFRAGVEALAAHKGDEPLYDPARLSANQVPVAAVIYHDDISVDAGLSLETARQVAKVQAWMTNEFEHHGVRRSPYTYVG